ncbi:hypothetical protein [Meridianimarinicoccus aquatilis]|uniref:Exopolysaccharide production protein YjbE n=1 Tax=Meridianimarinicoccus aquatilis TaxID=2552766 RepID=A0A4R6B088_9RHOB|nr:hypothetical protein [Fluviibacterium aquatile]TDL88146.1 hypothetical protein E2L05_08880 [Fluviibacterium aquatile]
MKKIISVAVVTLMVSAGMGFAQAASDPSGAAVIDPATSGGGLSGAGAGVGGGVGVGVAVGAPLATMAIGIAAVESSQGSDSQPTSTTTTN